MNYHLRHQIIIFFPHPEWNHELGDNFTYDYRPVIDLSDTMQVWTLDIISSRRILLLDLNIENLDSYPVVLTDNYKGNLISLLIIIQNIHFYLKL